MENTIKGAKFVKGTFYICLLPLIAMNLYELLRMKSATSPMNTLPMMALFILICSYCSIKKKEKEAMTDGPDSI